MVMTNRKQLLFYGYASDLIPNITEIDLAHRNTKDIGVVKKRENDSKKHH